MGQIAKLPKDWAHPESPYCSHISSDVGLKHLFHFCRKQNRHDWQPLSLPPYRLPIVMAWSFDYGVGRKAHEYVPKFSLRAPCWHMKCSFMNTPAQVGRNKDHQSIRSVSVWEHFPVPGAINYCSFRYCSTSNTLLNMTLEFVDCVIDVNVIIMVHCNL